MELTFSMSVSVRISTEYEHEAAIAATEIGEDLSLAFDCSDDPSRIAIVNQDRQIIGWYPPQDGYTDRLLRGEPCRMQLESTRRGAGDCRYSALFIKVSMGAGGASLDPGASANPDDEDRITDASSMLQLQLGAMQELLIDLAAKNAAQRMLLVGLAAYVRDQHGLGNGLARELRRASKALERTEESSGNAAMRTTAAELTQLADDVTARL